MNEELNTKMLDYLTTLENLTKGAADFAASEVPLVVSEYLQWHFISNLTGASLAFLFSVVILVTLRNVFKKIAEDDYVSACLINLIILVILAIPVGLMSQFTMETIKNKVSPRLVILEKIESLRN